MLGNIKRKERKMIHLYTGEGKGKTTAAIGLCIRAAGRNFHVCFSQFMKGNDTGELYVLKNISNVTIFRSEKNFAFYHEMSQKEKEELTDIHNAILDKLLEQVEKRACQMIIMDEITYPVYWGLLDKEKLKKLIQLQKEELEEEVELVLTGRNPDDFLMNAADYITDMSCIRHPFQRGVTARKGIEF